jgi:hypothetical protein
LTNINTLKKCFVANANTQCETVKLVAHHEAGLDSLVLVYAANFSNFNALYGAMGGIMMFLLWIYLSSCVGVFGVCFCAAQVDIRENQE